MAIIRLKNANSFRAEKVICGEKFSKNFPSKQEAQDWLDLIFHHNKDTAIGKAARAELEEIRSNREKKAIPTLTQAIEDYELHFHELNLKDDKPIIQLKRMVEFIGDVAITEVSRLMVENALDDIAQARSLSKPSVNRYQSAISGLFKWLASQRRYREYQLVNPTIGIIRKKESAGREVYLTLEQQTELLKACKSSRWRGLYPLVYLLLLTGARRNEVAALRWSQIDLQGGVISFHNTKNGNDHALKISDEAMNVIHEWKLIQPLSNWVFPNPSDPRRYFRNFDNYWQQAKVLSNMPKDLRIHDLRHSAATQMLQEGRSLEEIKQTLNHKSMSMTIRYAHHQKVITTVSNRALLS